MVMSLWLHAFRFRKTTCNPHCIFGTSNYKLWWIISDLQFLCNHTTDDDPSWATDARATMKQTDRYKGRKESLGKETDALDPDEHFDVIALMLEPSSSCCMCLCVWGGGVGHIALKIILWAVETICNMLHRVILYCLRVITSYSYILSLWCSYTRYMFTLTTLLVRNGYLAENRVLSKRKAEQSELGLCKLKLYVVIFHTQISTYTSKKF
jgi:hypothetical protein